MNLKSIAPLFAIAVLASCGGKQQAEVATTPPADSSQAPEAKTPSPVIAEVTSAEITVEPKQMTSCEPIVSTVKWDIRQKHPTVSDVEIVVGPDSAPTLFAAGGSYGETKTGPWTTPGAIFRLRDKSSGTELERAIIAGPKCE